MPGHPSRTWPSRRPASKRWRMPRASAPQQRSRSRREPRRPVRERSRQERDTSRYYFDSPAPCRLACNFFAADARVPHRGRTEGKLGQIAGSREVTTCDGCAAPVDRLGSSPDCNTCGSKAGGWQHGRPSLGSHRCRETCCWRRRGALAGLRRRGNEQIHYHQTDCGEQPADRIGRVACDP